MSEVVRKCITLKLYNTLAASMQFKFFLNDENFKNILLKKIINENEKSSEIF
jgi:hypothetical protein